MARETGPFQIVGDDSGHEYVIPIVRRAHWAQWIDSQDWQDGIVPEYAERIDGHFTILDYSIS